MTADAAVFLTALLATLASFAESGWILSVALISGSALIAFVLVAASGICRTGSDMESMNEPEQPR